MTELEGLLRYTRATAIVGDILKIRAHDVGLGDMALVEMPDGEQSLAQAIQLEGDAGWLLSAIFVAGVTVTGLVSND